MSSAQKQELVDVYNFARARGGNPRAAIRAWEEENFSLSDADYVNLLERANLAWENAGKAWIIGEAAARESFIFYR